MYSFCISYYKNALLKSYGLEVNSLNCFITITKDNAALIKYDEIYIYKEIIYWQTIVLIFANCKNTVSD